MSGAACTVLVWVCLVWLADLGAALWVRWRGVRPYTDEVYAALRERDDALVTAD